MAGLDIDPVGGEFSGGLAASIEEVAGGIDAEGSRNGFCGLLAEREQIRIRVSEMVDQLDAIDL